MEELIIRNVTFQDLPQVVDIQVRGWQAAYRGIIDDDILDTLDKNEKLEKRKKDFNSNGFIVAELKKRVVGFCRYVDNDKHSIIVPGIDCELLALYVEPTLKHNGIGTKLFNYVVDEFKSKNKKSMILWCLRDNEPSKKFYTKMGGTIVSQKMFEVKGRSYPEVGFLYEL